MTQTVEFIPLPDPWPEAPIAVLANLYQCEDCCTAATAGDLCGPCDEKYKLIGNALRPWIRAEREARERAEAALREIAVTPCAIFGHSVAVGCKASGIATRALAHAEKEPDR